MRVMRLLPAALAVAVPVVLAGCTSTVSGSAEPAPATSTTATRAGDPCALLTPEQAGRLGYGPEGDFTEGDPGRFVPPTCYWNSEDLDAELGSLSVGHAVGFSLAEYVGGVVPVDQFDLGGLSWERYPDPFGDENACILATELSATSFVVLTGGDRADPAKACAGAKAAAPLIASHLPGGDPAPSAPPSPPPPPPGPLDGVDPCAMLAPGQAEQLTLEPAGRPTVLGDFPPGCNWSDSDGDGGMQDLVLYLASAKPADEWIYADDPGEPLQVDDRTWTVYPQAADSDTTCVAILPVTPTSSVMMLGGNHDPAKVCDGIRMAAAMVSGRLGS